MSLYSKQKFYCNACGKELFCTINQMMGGQILGFKCCSMVCVREIQWRRALSIMGKEYYPDPEPYKEPQ